MRTKTLLALCIIVLAVLCSRGETNSTAQPVLVSAQALPAEAQPGGGDMEAGSPPGDDAVITSPNFTLGTRIYSDASQAQIAFVNGHYHFVKTPILDQAMREAIHGPELILYRSIQGTWANFNQFDWEHINATETMFEHHQGERIRTIWKSWLMNTDDLVPSDAPDALDHWVNYYTVTASDQIYEYGCDGLFIDSANHVLNAGAVSGQMPDDYSDAAWYQGRVASLAFIKSYLPDKTVIFNGLHTGGGAEDSLANTDGGMWETFAYQPSSGEYKGVEDWYRAISLFDRHAQDKTLALIAKRPGLVEDIQARTFIVSSYLLVSRPNIMLAMVDPNFDELRSIFYYPEYTLDLGAPLSDFSISSGQTYASRQFENGFVLVNPHEDQTITYRLDGEYLQVIPVGGGIVPVNGDWQGTLKYKALSDQIELPPISGMILVRP